MTNEGTEEKDLSATVKAFTERMDSMADKVQKIEAQSRVIEQQFKQKDEEKLHVKTKDASEEEDDDSQVKRRVDELSDEVAEKAAKKLSAINAVQNEQSTWDQKAFAEFPLLYDEKGEFRKTAKAFLDEMPVLGYDEKGQPFQASDAVYNAAVKAAWKLQQEGKLPQDLPDDDSAVSMGRYRRTIHGKTLNATQRSICEMLGVDVAKAEKRYAERKKG
ncbi:MAG: hypothetical protein UY96_C0022G0003 [Parcubacteria group bacterium GW2011_GWB1_56_8]|nr:MAG: hypothetical protein UY96_C0022G0003 [Parcubacteria group bacterium GW2011_GWB1_56_8]